jgi:hypothetical protein
VETTVEATAMSMNMSTHAATNTSMSTHTVAVVIDLLGVMLKQASACV